MYTLILDPDVDRAQLIQSILAKYTEISIVSTVREAVESLRKQQPNVFLLSLEQDTGDGFELCSYLHRRGLHSTKLIYGEPIIQEMEGVDAFIPMCDDLKLLEQMICQAASFETMEVTTVVE